MKGSCALVASLLAASTFTFTFSVQPHQFTSPVVRQVEEEEEVRPKKTWSPQNREDKFAPKFDGLRFIETLITAHR